MSPELFDPESWDHRPTKSSDCYALGMVIWEVLSGRLPFYQFPKWLLSLKIFNGDRPERPQGEEGAWFTDGVWEILGSCWIAQPEGRPSIEDVLQCLGKASRSWKPPCQLLSVLSTANSLTQELSDIVTVESMDVGGASPSSQPLERLDQEEPARTLNQVSSPPRINEQITGVDATVLGSRSFPTPASFTNFTWLVSFGSGIHSFI